MLLTEFYTLPVTQTLARPSDYLRAAAAAGETHMGLCGETMESMLQRGESMMIARSALRFVRPDLQANTVRTRQISLHGVRAERLFEFYCGDVLTAEAINEYFCVKLETRRVFRPEWFMHPGTPYAGTLQLRRVAVPENGIQVAAHTVDDAFIDYNGHLNNTYYCDYAMEAFEHAEFPFELYIQYLHELLPHAAFTLHRSIDGATVYGMQGETASFAALRVDAKGEQAK